MVMFPVPFVIPSAVADSTGNGFRCAKGPCTGYILISAVQLAQTKLAANVRPMGTFIGTTELAPVSLDTILFNETEKE
jgi:hypothetical protein